MNRAYLLWGIGLFVFGMSIFEESIKSLANRAVRRALQIYTKSSRMSAWIGMLMTWITQSSTIIGMIVIGFVGAWVLWLSNAIGVIIGANIGSTFTPWLVVLLWFKVDISLFSLYFIGLGWLWLILTENRKLLTISKFLMWFGLLFLGLFFMKEGVDEAAALFDFAFFAERGLLAFVLLGTIMTVILQTSAAVSVIALAALNGGVITYTMTIGIMIGANIGTALTTWVIAFISRTGKSIPKKQVALAHVIFNCIAASIVIIALPQVLQIVEWIVGVDDPLTSIVVFHTLFNVVGALLLLPFVDPYSKLILRILPTPKVNLWLATDNLATNMPEEVIPALEHDIRHIRWSTLRYMACVFGYNHPTIHKQHTQHTPKVLHVVQQVWWRISSVLTHHPKQQDDNTQQHTYIPGASSCNMTQYIHLKKVETHMYSFFVHVDTTEMNTKEQEYIHQLHWTMNMVLDSAKKIKENTHHIENIVEIPDKKVVKYRQILTQHIEDIAQRLSSGYANPATLELPELNGEIDDLMMQAIQHNKELHSDDIAEILKTHRHIHASITKLIEAYQQYLHARTAYHHQSENKA